MSVGFNKIITFDEQGKITDYQKSFSNNYSKIVKIYLPMKFCSNDYIKQTPMLMININNTFPKIVEKILGVKSETDLNCYIFDLSVFYANYYNEHKIGLSKFILENDNNIIFTSQTFRV